MSSHGYRYGRVHFITKYTCTIDKQFALKFEMPQRLRRVTFIVRAADGPATMHDQPLPLDAPLLAPLEGSLNTPQTLVVGRAGGDGAHSRWCHPASCGRRPLVAIIGG
eukprot:SAG31_NODE_23_length_33717_cov_17.863585_9_plen_108_part_00